MLGHHSFYFGTIRKYVILFGSLFNDITIKRDDSDGVSQHVIQIPIQYGPREKFLARLEGDPTLYEGRPQAISLPRMSFKITNLEYDSNRSLTGTNRIVVEDPDSNNKFRQQYFPSPYDITFELSIYCKNAEDGARIVEQIYPFFKPDWTASVELIEETGKLMDVGIVLQNTHQEDVYEGNFQTRRVLVWTINFVMKGWFYGPVVSKPIVKFVTTNFMVGNVADGNSPISTLIVYPGLLANGQPTSNSLATVHWSEINVNDDYGFVEEYYGEQVIE